MKKDMVWPCRVSAVVLTIDAEGNYSLERMNQERYVSVAFITGEAVGSKEYDASNPIVRRIESNKDIKEVVFENTEANQVDGFIYAITIDCIKYKDIYVEKFEEPEVVVVEEPITPFRQGAVQISANMNITLATENGYFKSNNKHLKIKRC